MSIRRSSRAVGNGIHGEPAYVLHHYEWSESSLILELFTRKLGRVAAVAKGVRKPASSFRSVLLPFQPLLISLGPEAEIRTLRGAEWAGGYVMPTGETLLIAFYVNELLMRLLARDDPQPLVFDAYIQTLAALAQHMQPTDSLTRPYTLKKNNDRVTQPLLRAFELILLRALGVLPILNVETLTLRALELKSCYTLDVDAGLIPQWHVQDSKLLKTSSTRVFVQSCHWENIQQAFDSSNILSDLPKAVAPVTNELKVILRMILNHHAGVTSLKTRQLMQSLQKQS